MILMLRRNIRKMTIRREAARQDCTHFFVLLVKGSESFH
jgi:hypothetical protein